MTGTRQGNVDHLFKRKPFGVAHLERAARRAANNFTTSVRLEDELAADLRDDQKRAELLRRPSTSINPWRCVGCAGWCDATRTLCKWCGADRATATHR